MSPQPQTQELILPSLETSVVERIVSSIHPTRIYLFGSRATGNARPDSDVDLLVIYDGPRDIRDVQIQLGRLMGHFDIASDVFVMSSSQWERNKTVANTIAREVNDRGVAIYG